jgi:hypothetical protein
MVGFRNTFFPETGFVYRTLAGKRSCSSPTIVVGFTSDSQNSYGASRVIEYGFGIGLK